MSIKSIFEKVIGTYSDRELKRLQPIAAEVEALESEYHNYTDEQLKAKTPELKERLKKGETQEDILPEAFAAVREAFVRTLNKKPFHVQIIGAIVLHQGRIAEMKTGEGKTFVAVLAAYLNALEEKGVHIVTVNDYLAKFQSEQMGMVFKFMGLSVGLITHGLDNKGRKDAYACDVTYATNNELGFDYLRDNMVMNKDEMVQRELNYAIVDEVDSILIDEARTPLIISGVGTTSTDLYKKADQIAARMKATVIKETDSKQDMDEIDATADYIVDEKANTATLTDVGMRKAEQYFGISDLSDPDNIKYLHHINQAVKAHGIMKLDRDYVVQNGQVIIVDEFTGRLMYGRRFNEGLHQAIEAKENVKVEKESRTLATITFQNYFRLYKKLSGMTGTALTEEEEFNAIYSLDVVAIPTNKPMIRTDYPDAVYKTEAGKFRAVVRMVNECVKTGQPVLIGTISIEKSEFLGDMLRRSGVKHVILNAKYHDKEAEIVAQAGRFGAVTIATNMAGRGTDILLGGNPEFLTKQELKKEGFSEHAITESNGFGKATDDEVVKARARYSEIYSENEKITNEEKQKVIDAGGLFIIGTERHESRRIDNQLRGRSGRQGDPGKSKFYISLEDDLMRLFGSDRMLGMVNRLGLDEDTPIEAGILSGAIENAQKRVEGRNFDIRKNVLEYDDVMNQQRKVIYSERNRVLSGDNLKEYFIHMIDTLVDGFIKLYCSESAIPEDWDTMAMRAYIEQNFIEKGVIDESGLLSETSSKDKLRKGLKKIIYELYDAKEKEYGEEFMRELERVVLLRNVNEKWMDHIDAMDQLRHGIGLRAYGQKDPIMAYKFEGFDMFDEMNHNIQEDSVRIILKGRLQKGAPAPESPKQEIKNMQEIKQNAEDVLRKDVASFNKAATSGKPVQKPVVNTQKTGRNDKCPCGSGKKYKDCCGKGQ